MELRLNTVGYKETVLASGTNFLTHNNFDKNLILGIDRIPFRRDP